MKTIIISIFLLSIGLSVKSQTTDLMYVPDQKSLVVTYNSNYSPIGFYVGGYFTSTFPQPYIYTTPLSIMNRIGISFSNGQVGLMVGVQVKSYVDSLALDPDIWFKVYPLRLLTKTKEDLTLLLVLIVVTKLDTVLDYQYLLVFIDNE
jgi:hypothetical protein